MMKRNKFLALGLALVMALTLAACGNDAADSTPSPSATAGEENNTGSKTYQFTGKYEEDSANASMLNAAFLLNLNEDGTAVADRYMFDNYDDSDAATNPTYTASYMSGTWKEAERDGVACLQIKLAYVDEAGNESNGQTAYAYDVAGVYSFDMTFPVVPGMSYTRTATMEGTEGKTYEDANAFIQAFKAEFVAPENVAALTDEENGGTAYLQPDGTLLIYAGYNNVAQGTWNVENGALTVTINDAAVNVTADGNKATFSYDYSMAEGYSTTYTFVCEDVTALSAPAAGETGSEGGETEAEGIASYDAGGLVLVLLDDTNMKVEFPEYDMERDGFTYVLDGNTLTVTAPGEDVLGAFGQIWSAMGGETWTIDGNTATKAG